MLQDTEAHLNSDILVVGTHQVISQIFLFTERSPVETLVRLRERLPLIY